MQNSQPEKISPLQGMKLLFGKMGPGTRIFYVFFWFAFLLFWAAHLAMIGLMIMLPSLWLYSKIITDTQEWWHFTACVFAAVFICGYAIHCRPSATIQKTATQA